MQANIIFKIVFIGATLFLVQCGPVHDSNGIASNPSVSQASVDSFSKTLYPIIETNCAICHNGSTAAPLFAQDQAILSLSALLDLGLINKSTPANSKLVTKISGGHNGINTNLADDISQAIIEWLNSEP